MQANTTPNVIVDCLDQKLTLGDIVIPTYGSTVASASVVTRLGATTKVQLNGGSYVESTMLCKINEQYVVAKGLAGYDKLVNQYKHEFNFEAVSTKPKPTKYFVVQVGDYDKWVNNSQKVVSPKRYFVVSVTGSRIEDYFQDFKSKHDYFNTLGNSIQVLELKSRSYESTKKYGWGYFEFNKLVSKRTLTGLGLDTVIDKEFDISLLMNNLGARLKV